MQIDMHHSAIYVLCRLAGMKSKYAQIVAYASQHVDDANHGHTLKFENEEIFRQTLTSHTMLSVMNFDVSNSLDVWVPFHFLPCGKDGTDSDYLVTGPDSPIVELLKDDLQKVSNEPLALYRLGIGLHAYADTYSHQDFKGFYDNYNNIRFIDEGEETLLRAVVRKTKEKIWLPFEELLSLILPRVGHGKAMTFPDIPFMFWSYSRDSKVYKVDNLNDRYIVGLESIYKFLQRYLKENPQYGSNSTEKDFKYYRDQFMEMLSFDGSKDERHNNWLDKIHENYFKFADFDEIDRNISYDSREWYNEAVSYTKIAWWKKILLWPKYRHHNYEEYKKKNNFNNSHWVKFMRAAAEHKYIVVHIILPECGVEVG
ncbi:MAG: hypothetical protein KAX49_16125 [Halanaerobiales bacterium]|nr:hypothetical protein [Halanaerobiales bacterium]